MATQTISKRLTKMAEQAFSHRNPQSKSGIAKLNHDKVAYVEAEYQKMLDSFAATIHELRPGQNIQVFGRNEEGEVCKVFGLVHRDQIEANQGIYPSVFIALMDFVAQSHECGGETPCALEKILAQTPFGPAEISIFDITKMEVKTNDRGPYLRIVVGK